MSRLLLLLLFTFVSYVSSINECLELNISIIQTIDHSGFHNKINWMLEFLPSDLAELERAKAKFALYIKIPSGMYVNPDEIDDLSRLSEYSVYVDGKVNAEAPENEAQPHDVFIFLPEIHGDKLEVMLPVHLRYQMAKIGGGFGKVLLSKPSLLMLSSAKLFKTCGALQLIKAPCDCEYLKKCDWSNISYEALFDDVEMLVPLGNVDHFPIVAVTTLVLGCIGCMYILSILSTRRTK